MIVIVPHRDLELKLINAQKKLIKEIFKGDNGITPYAAMPLWIPVDFKTVEQAKAEITKVTLLTPEYNDKGCFVCPVEIECAGGDVLESKLDFVRGLPRSARNDVQSFRHCEERSDVAIQSYDNTFPLAVKIFRLGECTSPKPGVYELASTVWKKLTS